MGGPLRIIIIDQSPVNIRCGVWRAERAAQPQGGQRRPPGIPVTPRDRHVLMRGPGYEASTEGGLRRRGNAALHSTHRSHERASECPTPGGCLRKGRRFPSTALVQGNAAARCGCPAWSWSDNIGTVLNRKRRKKLWASESLGPKKRLNRRPTNGGWWFRVKLWPAVAAGSWPLIGSRGACASPNKNKKEAAGVLKERPGEGGGNHDSHCDGSWVLGMRCTAAQCPTA